MSAVRSTDTALERRFQLVLREAGLAGFEVQAKDLPGRPDIVFRRAGVAIFLDSCFWHGCRSHLRMPASNRRYWKHKIAETIARDKRVARHLRRIGWSVYRCWEHDLREPRNFIERLKRRLDGVLHLP